MWLSAALLLAMVLALLGSLYIGPPSTERIHQHAYTTTGCHKTVETI